MNEVVVFGGGCFWCTEAVFRMLKGVISVIPGYAGGDATRATYKEVTHGDTGHAEVIQITFDSSIISFLDLLAVFFVSHDATTLNRQGADVGEQYRSVIFYTNDAQKVTAEAYIADIQKEYSEHIVTEVIPLEQFFKAEDYHHDYYAQNKGAPYCQIVIAPKIEKVEKQFSALMETHGK